MLDDGDDLLRLVALGGPRGPAPAEPLVAEAPPPPARRRRGRPPRDQAGPAAAALDDEEAALQALVALGERQATRVHEQRSWQMMESVRAVKKLKVVHGQLVTATVAKQRSEAIVGSIALQFPGVARAFGLKSKAVVMDETRAALVIRVAVVPAFRGEGFARIIQARSADLVAHVALKQQQDFLNKIFRFRMCDAEPDAIGTLAGARFLVFSWQWDETSQRIKTITKEQLQGERQRHGAVAVQVMVQCGMITAFEITADGSGKVVERQPVLARCLRLEEQTSNGMLEGMARECPIKFDNLAQMVALASGCEVAIMAFCCDRASANMSALSWVFHVLQQDGFPSNILPFVEPCAAHGVALVKGKPKCTTALVSAASSFSSLMRQWRFTKELRDAMVNLVQIRLKVKTEVRPPADHQHAKKVLDMLYGLESQEYLFKVNRKGERVRTSFGEDLDAIAAAASFGGGETGDLVHYCWVEVEEGSEEHRSGGRCCDSFGDSVSKVVVPLLNFLVHRPWDRSCASRWTFVMTAFKKLLVGFLVGGLLPAALRQVQATWGSGDHLETILERLVAADQSDFQSKSKLRLMRTCRALCISSAPSDLVIVITALSQVDPILYDLLGDGRRERANLEALLSPSSAILARSQENLLALLDTWHVGSSPWKLFEAMGGAFTDNRAMSFARQLVLQLHCALHDHFAGRMSHPPYNLFRSLDPELQPEDRRALLQDLFDRRYECLSLFCRRLRDRYPTPAALQAVLPHVLKSLSEGTRISIDFSERMHAQMRIDLRTTGRTRSATASTNRVLCQQVRAEHLRITGEDIAHHAQLPSGGLAGVAPNAIVLHDGPSRIPSVRGGNPEMEWRNNKMAAFKQRRAPDRALTGDELLQFRQQCQKWHEVTEVEKENWARIWRASLNGRRAAHAAAAPAVPHRADCKGLWGCAAKGPPVSLASLVTEHKQTESSIRRCRAFNDPMLVVSSPMPPRVADVPKKDHDPVMFGCAAEKKNVCRHSLDAGRQVALDAMCTRLSKWVDSMGPACARLGDKVLLLRGVVIDGNPIDMVVSLLDCRFRPKMQYYSKCVMKHEEGQQSFIFPDELPAVVRPSVVASSITARRRAVHTCSSDDLALELVDSGRTWSMIPLEWKFPDGTDNLFDMEITSMSVPFEPPAAAKARTQKSKAASSAMDLGDPLASGIAQGVARCGGLPASSPLPGDAGPVHHGFDARAFADEEMFEGLRPDEIAAIREDFELAMGMLPGDVIEDPPVNSDGDDPFGAESEAEDVALEALIADGEGEAASAPVPPIELTPAECAEVAQVSGMGYITCPIPPWDSKPMIGRLTSWPEARPMLLRSVSLKCYLHPGCGSPAKGRWAVSDNQLLRWLFSGVCEEGATKHRKHELRLLHAAAWQPIFDEGIAPPPATAEGSAASSSSDALPLPPSAAI